jgi:4-amino-4-deoxy-L-arabinose transferase-like glycosyltransferase
MLESNRPEAAVQGELRRNPSAFRVRPIVAIVAVSVALRVLIALYMGDEVTALPGIFDQLAYDRLAQSLLAGRGYQFTTAWYPFTAADTPTAHWSFLYPLYLAGVYFFAGYHPLVARLIQAAVVGFLLPWLAYRLGGRLFGQRAGLLAAAATAGYGYFIYYNAALMTESFYLVLTLSAVVAAYALAEDEAPPIRSWALLGLLLGGAVLLRQVFLFYVPVLLLWIGWRRGFRSSAEGMVAAAGLVALLVLPWTVRNYLRYGRFLLLNSNAGYAFYTANHPDHGTHWNPDYVAPIPTSLQGQNEAALDRELTGRGLGFVAAEPARYAALTLSRLPYHFRFWPTPGSNPLSEAVRFLSFGLYLPFMVAGLVLSRARWRRLLPIYLFGLIFIAVHVLSWPGPRYRFPVDALYMVFVGLALSRLLDWAAARRR